MPPKVTILKGLPASGKTTYAKEWCAQESHQNHIRINYDELRTSMFGDVPWTRENEVKMKAEALRQATDLLNTGWSLVIDNTNLSRGARKPWVDLGQQMGVPVAIHEMPTTRRDCIDRDSKRTGKARVGQAVIDRMALFHGLIDWSDDRLVLVDMDGTLADTSTRQHFVEQSPKDWDGWHAHVGEDAIKIDIADVVDALAATSTIVIVSGRAIDRAGTATEDWLNQYAVPFNYLFMRNGGDFRPDTVVKKEILDLLPKDRILCVLDDRDSVVEMWRANGLTCLQVAKGAF